MPRKLILFDLDGTILDTLADLQSSLNAALTAESLPERSLVQVRRDVGNGIRRLIQRSVPVGTDPVSVDRLYGAFTAHYRLHCADATAPYPGIPALLRELRALGYCTAVVSNKADFAVRLLCERFFPGQFDLCLGEQPGLRKKPAPDGVEYVLKTLGFRQAEAVYVGDSQVDVETARNAGLPCVSVDWGFRDRTELLAAGAERLVSSPAELFSALTEDAGA